MGLYPRRLTERNRPDLPVRILTSRSDHVAKVINTPTELNCPMFFEGVGVPSGLTGIRVSTRGGVLIRGILDPTVRNLVLCGSGVRSSQEIL